MSARKAETDHFEALAELRAEKIKAIKECTEIHSQKSAVDQKCHELTTASIRLRRELDVHFKNAADLSDVTEMSDV